MSFNSIPKSGAYIKLKYTVRQTEVEPVSNKVGGQTINKVGCQTAPATKLPPHRSLTFFFSGSSEGLDDFSGSVSTFGRLPLKTGTLGNWLRRSEAELLQCKFREMTKRTRK